jgi:acetyl esterase/lipase
MAACVETHSIPAEWIPHLDPEWVSLWNDHGRHQYRADEVSVPEYRKNPKAYSFTYAAWSGPKVFQEEEFDVPVTKPSGTVRVRVYTPEGEGPFPVHINYHGGGWVLGGLESEAAWCRSICNNVNIKVIDVDYRMAPEFLFPTAIYDSWEVVQWVRCITIDLKGCDG